MGEDTPRRVGGEHPLWGSEPSKGGDFDLRPTREQSRGWSEIRSNGCSAKA